MGLGLLVDKCAISFLGSVWATTFGDHFAAGGVFLEQKLPVLPSEGGLTHPCAAFLTHAESETAPKQWD